MSHHVRVNPITCEAHGICAELLPERITLDEWGYPIVDEATLHREELDHARRAARACPTLALLLQRERARPAPSSPPSLATSGPGSPPTLLRPGLAQSTWAAASPAQGP